MRIEHIAIWVKDLEQMRTFYEKYFNASSNELYHNKTKQFKSYFLTFSDGARLELMHRPDISTNPNTSTTEHHGYIHYAMSVGSKEEVDRLTERLREDGLSIIGEPRTTGDGYYESVILDPEGNRIEITV